MLAQLAAITSLSGWIWVLLFLLLAPVAWCVYRPLCRRLDRRLLQLEAEGWIFYKHKKPSTGGLGGALLELQKTVSPSARQIVAVHDEAETGEDQASESSPKILPRRLDR